MTDKASKERSNARARIISRAVCRDEKLLAELKALAAHLPNPYAHLTPTQYQRVEDAWHAAVEAYNSDEATNNRLGEPIPLPAFQCARCKRTLIEDGTVETHYFCRSVASAETGWLLCGDCVEGEADGEPDFDDFLGQAGPAD